MPEKKRQHYVPKSYMKTFSNDGKTFAIFNLKDKTSYAPVPYDSQCYADYFYGEDSALEDRLGEMEKAWKTVLDNVRNQSPLSSDDIFQIKEFAIFQRQRTLAESEYGRQEKIELYIECGRSISANKGLPFDDAAKEACMQYANEHAAPPAEILLKEIDTIAPLVSDLELAVINYNTQLHLISSDVPVILINPFCPQQIGFGCMGLIILFPISPCQLVVLYDAKMYPRFKGKTYISLSNEKEVYNLNVLQLISAEKILFGCTKNDFLPFKPQAFRCRTKNRAVEKVTSLGPEGHKLIMTSLRKTIYDCSFSFGKIRPDFNAVPVCCREAAPRIWEKEWEDKLRTSGDIVHQIARIKDSPLKSFSGKEYHRARDQLLRCALKYWRE